MGFVNKIKEWLDADKSIRKIAGDMQIANELILLLRVIFADGLMRPEENQCFQEICKTEFGIPEKDMIHVYDYLRDFGYKTSLKDAAAFFKGLDLERKRSLLTRMYDIARSDYEIVMEELEVIRRTADILGVNPNHIVSEAV